MKFQDFIDLDLLGLKENDEIDITTKNKQIELMLKNKK